MIHSTAKQIVVRENELIYNHTILPGALVLPQDRVTVQWNYNYEQAPLGFARNFEREGNLIWATIDWISEQWKAFYDQDGTFSKDYFDVSAYCTEVKLNSDDDGNFVVEHGVIKAVSIIPIPYLPKEAFRGLAKAEVEKD